jgi:hypothetical protein
MPTTVPTPELIAEFTKVALDHGQLMEAGWLGFRYAAIPANAPTIQIDEMRGAFFAGAQHLFGTILSILDPGAEPTEADLRRMDLIKSELDEFIRQFKRKHGIA